MFASRYKGQNTKPSGTNTELIISNTITNTTTGVFGYMSDAYDNQVNNIPMTYENGVKTNQATVFGLNQSGPAGALEFSPLRYPYNNTHSWTLEWRTEQNQNNSDQDWVWYFAGAPGYGMVCYYRRALMGIVNMNGNWTLLDQNPVLMGAVDQALNYWAVQVTVLGPLNTQKFISIWLNGSLHIHMDATNIRFSSMTRDMTGGTFSIGNRYGMSYYRNHHQFRLSNIARYAHDQPYTPRDFTFADID